MKRSHLTALFLVLIAALGGFYGGLHYEMSRVTSAGSASAVTAGTGPTGGGVASSGTGSGQAGGFGAGGGRGGNVGTITNLTATGFTLHSAGGSDINVLLAPQATVRKTADAQRSELHNNLLVTVTGQRDANGIISATAVTIVPAAATPGG